MLVIVLIISTGGYSSQVYMVDLDHHLAHDQTHPGQM